jgi:hypothetical protein
MYQADTSVGFFRRTKEELLPQANMTRVCRKFEKIRTWAINHHAIVLAMWVMAALSCSLESAIRIPFFLGF